MGAASVMASFPYSLIFASRLPSASTCRHWGTEVVGAKDQTFQAKQGFFQKVMSFTLASVLASFPYSLIWPLNFCLNWTVKGVAITRGGGVLDPLRYFASPSTVPSPGAGRRVVDFFLVLKFVNQIKTFSAFFFKLVLQGR